MGNVRAVIGTESHTTSRGWASLSTSNIKLNCRNAKLSNWLTKFGDKHASWAECYFSAENGQLFEWEAGSDSGNRGADRNRQKFTLRFDESLPIQKIDFGIYPAKPAQIEGRFEIVKDHVNQPSEEIAL